MPVASISCPDAGEDIKAEHIREPVAALLAECEDIRTGTGGLDKMVLKAGDTMTGQLFVTPSAGNINAIQAIGSGTGDGLIVANGTTQTSVAPTRSVGASGYIQLTGVDPNKGVNPGADDVLHGANITKAWGTVSLTGGAPYATQDDYNVTDVTLPFANIYQINFVRPFANATYAITFTPGTPGVGVSISTKNAAYCRFNVWDTTAPGTPMTNETVDFHAVGRQ